MSILIAYVTYGTQYGQQYKEFLLKIHSIFHSSINSILPQTRCHDTVMGRESSPASQQHVQNVSAWLMQSVPAVLDRRASEERYAVHTSVHLSTVQSRGIPHVFIISLRRFTQSSYSSSHDWIDRIICDGCKSEMHHPDTAYHLPGINSTSK